MFLSYVNVKITCHSGRKAKLALAFFILAKIDDKPTDVSDDIIFSNFERILTTSASVDIFSDIIWTRLKYYCSFVRFIKARKLLLISWGWGFVVSRIITGQPRLISGWFTPQ